MNSQHGRGSWNGSLASRSLEEIRALRKKMQGVKKQAIAPVLARQQRGSKAPASFAQERLWFLDQLGMVGPAYNTQRALRLRGDLDVAALSLSIDALTDRHESLRTRFEADAGTPVQVIEKHGSVALELEDLSSLAVEQRPEAVERIASRESQRPFSLSELPLVRTMLLKLEEQEHVLLITMHHVVTDGWSWAVLTNELSELYRAHRDGRAPMLPELAVQYPDYAIWQRKWLQGDVLERQLRYWKEQLAGAPPELTLPTDRPRPPTSTFEGRRISAHLGSRLTAALNEIARSQGATPFMVVLAAFQLLLSRYAGQRDVVVGSVIAGRTNTQSEPLIGFFVNTLALRTDLSGNPTFRELLRRAKHVALGAYAHQELPFEKLVMELRPERDMTRQPIFQVALVMQNFPQEQWNWGEVTCTRLEFEHVAALFDLTLHVSHEADGLKASLVYATDLFDAPTVRRLMESFRCVLEEITKDPERQIQRIPLLTPAERGLVLEKFNATSRPYPCDEPIHRQFQRWVQRTPHAVAVIFGDQTFTYSELDHAAAQLAYGLRAAGMQAGEYVAILMPRSVGMLISMLAVLKSGAAYVPIDPYLPIERQRLMIRDCGARRVLLHQSPASELMGESVQWLDYSEVAREHNGAVHAIDDCFPSPLSPAYVMYTSGSTGVPKGVVVPHRAVNRLVINSNYAEIGPEDCIAHSSNPAFDASTFEIWGALLNGARVLIVPHSTMLEPHEFAQVLREHRVTVLWITIGLLSQYVKPLAGVFGQLRYLLTGGDVVEPRIARQVLQRGSPQHFINAYGPTECTTFSTTHLVQNADDGLKSIPIGRPISNTSVYILDEELMPVPIGVAGDIYIGGDGLALGYLNRPELTAARFVPNPFDDGSNPRLYRSGDIGRWRVDGTIDFLGRGDQQVKLRGFRVELGEIEAQLIEHPTVKEAVVLAREDTPGDKYLVAYVTPSSKTPPSRDELRAHLTQCLPEYMIPRAFVVVESFAVSSSGKLDRRKLPAPGASAFATRPFEAPRGQIETALAGIWQELLHVDAVGRCDDFFGLGGHSLLALQAQFQIRQQFGCNLTVRDIYTNSTLQDLAERIGGRRAEVEMVDLSKEAEFDFDVRADVRELRVPPEQILVTGAAGFVGRFVLFQLLEDTRSTIYCMVRADSRRQAQHRLEQVLMKWGLWREEFRSRIVGIPGDLRLPQLGIDDVTYASLRRNVDGIFHCATSMNHLETYAMAKAANVGATKELIRLAAADRPKLINHISTLSVFASGDEESRVVDEACSIEHERHRATNGYAASKWVSEKIFFDAARNGVACNVYRLGLVWADAEKGRYDELQREYRLLKSCIVSGFGIQNYTYPASPVPVDHVARSVVALASRHPRGGGVFHIGSGAPVANLFERMNGALPRAPLELVPFSEWVHKIAELHSKGACLPIVPLIESLFAMDEEALQEYEHGLQDPRTRYDDSRTRRELEHAGLASPVLDDDLIRKAAQEIVTRDLDVRTAMMASGERDLVSDAIAARPAGPGRSM